MTATQSKVQPVSNGAPLKGSPVLAAAPHRIGTVTLAVNDLAVVSAFYQEVIGLRVIDQTAGIVRLGTGKDILLELVARPKARRRSPREAGLFHTAFLLPSRADLGAWTQRAAERRLPIAGASDHRVSEAIYLSDPEGNGIEIYSDRPSAAWTKPDGTLEMTTEALDVGDLLRAGQGRAWSGYPAGGTVGHLHLQVGAIAPAEDFYAKLLGFDITARYPGGSFYGTGGYHHQLATNIWNSRGAGRREDEATGLAAFEIVAREPSLVAEARERLEAAGVPTQPHAGGFETADPWGTRVIVTTQSAS